MLAMEGMARLWTRQSSGYQRLWKLKLRLLPNTRVSPASPAHPGASRPGNRLCWRGPAERP
jgi:hypothetical protein